MDSAQKKNIALGAVALVLLGAALMLYYRDSIFASKAGPPAVDQETAAQVGNAVGATAVEPDPPNPPPRNSGKVRSK